MTKPGTRSAGLIIAREKEPDRLSPRILLADDQEEVLFLIAHLLEGEFHVIGTAENGKRALELATTLFPDVIVLDICMPELNGIAAAERLREAGSVSKVVFLTGAEDADFVDAALSAGALAYVLKRSASVD